MLQLVQHLAQTYTYTYDSTTTSSADAETAVAAFVGFMAIMLVFMLPVLIFNLIIMWKTFVKAGRPGWASIVPIYNAIVMIQIAGKPVWWIFLFFVPFVNIVVSILVHIEIAKRFGKDVVFGLVLAFLPVIGYAILAFGSAKYIGDGDEQMAAAPMNPAAMPPASPSFDQPLQPPAQPTATPMGQDQNNQPPQGLVQ